MFTNCRHKCSCLEDEKHVLMACPAVDAERRDIIKICKKHRYELNLTNLLTRNELQIAVEKLLYAFFRDEA